MPTGTRPFSRESAVDRLRGCIPVKCLQPPPPCGALPGDAPDGRVAAYVLDADVPRAGLAVPPSGGAHGSPDGARRARRCRDAGYRCGANRRASSAASSAAPCRRRWPPTGWPSLGSEHGRFGVVPCPSMVEEVTGAWLLDLLGLPAGASFGFDTGCQMADSPPGRGAPERARARRLGSRSGRPPRLRRASRPRRRGAPRDDRSARCACSASAPPPSCRWPLTRPGRMRPDALRAALAAAVGPTIVCAQVGNVNTGALRSPGRDRRGACRRDVWFHVDGAFGLWAAASPRHRHLVAGYGGADSWATDAHKWLNLPLRLRPGVRRATRPHRAAMVVSAAYLRAPGGRARRLALGAGVLAPGRGFAVYAALRSLGRRGVAELVERCCGLRAALRGGLGAAGRRGAQRRGPEPGPRALRRRRRDHRRTWWPPCRTTASCWMSPTTWRGRRAMRLSVCNWATTIAASIARPAILARRPAPAAHTPGDRSHDGLARPARRRRGPRGGLPRRVCPSAALGPAETDPAVLRAALGGPLPDGPEDCVAVLDCPVAGADPGLMASLSRRASSASSSGSRCPPPWRPTGSRRPGIRTRSSRSPPPPPPWPRRSWAAGWPSSSACPTTPSFATPPAARWPHATGLAAARHHVLPPAGWDVEARRPHGAPPISRAGRRRLSRDAGARRGCSASAPTASSASTTDGEGSMRPDALRAALAADDGPTIVCAQAGRSTPGPSIRSKPLRRRPRRRGLDALRRRLRPVGRAPAARRHLVPASGAPTRGPPTRTSG